MVVVVGKQGCNSLLWMLPVEVQQTVYQSLTVFSLVCKDQKKAFLQVLNRFTFTPRWLFLCEQTEDDFIHQHVFVCLIFIVSSPCPILLYGHLLVSVPADPCSVAPSWTAAMTREEHFLKGKAVTER